jgi:ankyrin repeat protein
MNCNAAMNGVALTADANPNAALLNGETVLMTFAHRRGCAVNALLARGPRQREGLSRDWTALMWAAAQSHAQVVRACRARSGCAGTLARLYATVTSEVTQRAGREEPNYPVPRGGSTPLLFAARAGDAESARVLLEAGADVNDTLPNGTSALTEAAHSGHQAAGIVLLDKGADPNAAASGYTALHAAVLRSGGDLVKALLAHGANPNAQITRGTPVRRNNPLLAELSSQISG